MDDKQAIGHLQKMLEKYDLSADEKEAVSNAIGMLSWSMLAESRIKNLKAKRDRK